MPNRQKRKAKIVDSLLKGTLESGIYTAATSYSDQALAQYNELLSIWGMTPLQFNALSVLYAHDSEGIGLPSKEIGSRLTTRVPDVTRLLDRMADKGWITRERDSINKRVVRSRLTEIGIELVTSAHAPMLELESKQLSHLTNDEKNTLSQLLKKALNT